MNKFGRKSIERLSTCDYRLQNIMHRVVARRDCSIVCGFRGKAEQDKAVMDGKSKVKWPNSKHNKLPSMAVDVVPWPEKWSDRLAFIELADIIRDEAAKESVELRWGGDWDGDGDMTDQSFNDLPHWEILEK